MNKQIKILKNIELLKKYVARNQSEELKMRYRKLNTEISK